MKEGKVVEQGTHPELVDRPNGAYATLVKLQVSAEQQNPKEAEAKTYSDDDSCYSAKVRSVEPDPRFFQITVHSRASM